MNKKNVIAIVLIVAVVFFGLGYFMPRCATKTTQKNVAVGQDTYQAGWNAAKKRLSESGYLGMMGNMQIKSVTGEVMAIKDNALTVKIRPLEPLADPALDERIVEINRDTKIYLNEPKDQAVYEKEMAEFNKKIQAQNIDGAPGAIPAAPSEPISIPSYFEKKEIKFADIKTGETVNVIASTDNIKDTRQFLAAEITVNSPNTAMPFGMPPADAAGTAPVPVGN